VAGRFGIAERGFDVNPVTWHTLARHGIAVRGPESERLNVWTDPAELRRHAAEFVAHVIDSANALAAKQGLPRGVAKAPPAGAADQFD
jgi:hypothetical protein